MSLTSRAVRAGRVIFVRDGRRGRAEPSPLAGSLPRKRCLSSSASETPESAVSEGSGDSAAPDVSPVHTSLALSVHFRHPSPDWGMKDYEILSRGTAFLLQVDPPDPTGGNYPSQPSQPEGEDSTSGDDRGFVRKSAFPHLQENASIRAKLLHKQDYKYDPAGGPPRLSHQLNWLEFCPTAFRPKVHVVASSHVISPWLWPKYYGHDWLRAVTQDHVRYSLEVWGGGEGGGGAISHDGRLRGEHRPLAKFALNPYPIHHPKELDLSVIHLKQEDAALDHLTKLGVKPLHLPTMHELETSTDPVFEPGDRVLFQGFEVYEANAVDGDKPSGDEKRNSEAKDDERIFYPYSSMGTLIWGSPDRFLARTGAPLPEGLCGGPVVQLPKNAAANNASAKGAGPLTVRGVVEGIVPANHEDKNLAGLAAFHPSYRLREFVDFAEQIMLQSIMDEDLFKRIVDMKTKKDKRGTTYRAASDGEVYEEGDAGESASGGREEGSRERGNDDDDDELPDDPHVRAGIEGTSEEGDTPHIDQEYAQIVSSLRKNHSPEEVDAILATVEREREEVARILQTEGGDVDDIIAAVRKRTYDEKDRILAEIEREMAGKPDPKKGKKT
ncbi:hypothetical protein ACHAWF_011947 [Thalassiosira exigua]